MNPGMKPRIAVHKFSSCDGCQLAFLNLGEDLLLLSSLVEFTFFAEAGFLDDSTPVDIAFVEGSISASDDIERIRAIRENSDFLVTIGACATAGGLQALRNLDQSGNWLSDIYATPGVLDSLDEAQPIAEHVQVDLELWGCPVNAAQVVAAVRSLLLGVLPEENKEKVCMECKRQQTVCVLVTSEAPCMGPVTRSGCGALCPRFGRDCYACYGPSESANTLALGNRFAGFGMLAEDIAHRFHAINSHAGEFLAAGHHWIKPHD